MGAVVGWLAGSVLRIRRRLVEAGLARLAPRSTREVRSLARAFYASLGTSAAELLWTAAHGDVPVPLEIAPALDEALRTSRASGLGMLLAISHTGNWEVAAGALAARVPLLAVVKRIQAASLDRFVTLVREARGIALSPPEGSVARALAMLGAGGAVAMMIDQVPDRLAHAIEAPFLGETAYVDRAPALLALRAGAPLLVLAAHREGGRQVVELLARLEPPRRDDPSGETWAREATLRATAALDAFVRRHPTEWLWLHRRWKAPPP